MWRSIIGEAWQKAFLCTKFFCALHVTNTYLFTFALTRGSSMSPTITVNGDFVLAECVSPRLGKVGSGDIVLLRSPLQPRLEVIKRVIGTEGDEVSYVVHPQNSDITETIVVPKGHIWVEGDNIYASRDSRSFGAIPYGLLRARVFWRILPIKQFGPLAPRQGKVNEP